MASTRTLLAAAALLIASVATADVTVTVTIARFYDAQLSECSVLSFEGWSESEIGNFLKNGGDDLIRIHEPCSEYSKRQNATKLATCSLEKKKDEKRLSISSAYYEEESTFGDGGFKAQCAERKGKWSETADGTKAAARVALPKANAAEVGAEYQNNEVAADSKYKGKKYLLTGEVQSVKKDARSRPYVQAKGGNLFIGVHLYLKDASHAASLSAGDVVKLQCVGKGKGRLEAPTFECSP